MDNGYGPVDALLIDLILENTFQNFSPSELRICRQVCTKWKTVGNLLLKKRWAFPIRFTTPPLKDVSQCDVDKVINSNFPSFKYINFDKFHFLWSSDRHTIEFISEVVKRYSKNCAELYLVECEDFSLVRTSQSLPIFDITPSLGQNLKLLSVVSSSNFMSISLKCLTSIQYLYLSNCTILLTGEMIKPKELLLCDVSFMKNEVVLNTVILKTFVDFCNMKKLYLLRYKGSFPYIIDEENKSISLDTFFVRARTIDPKINFYNLQWSVKNLSIDGFLFPKRWDDVINNSRIKDLEVLSVISGTIWNSNWIPPTIRKLSLRDITILPGFGNKLNFSNLKFLRLYKSEFDIATDTTDSITLLQECSDSLQNLEYLELANETDETRNIKSSMIPRNVKCLSLHGTVNLICDDERLIHLEKLILNDYPWQYIEVLQYKFSADLLVISSNINNGDEGCEKLIELMLHQSSTFKNIAVGKFQWETDFSHRNIRSFSVEQYVQEEAKYYLFKRKWGRSLEEKVFDDMRDLKIVMRFPEKIVNTRMARQSYYLL